MNGRLDVYIVPMMNGLESMEPAYSWMFHVLHAAESLRLHDTQAHAASRRCVF